MPVADQQLLRGVAGSIQTTIRDSDGDPASGLTVTVGVTKADGTVVIASGTAASEVGTTGTYTVAATAAQLDQLELLTATWKVGSETRAVTTHEVVGGVYCDVGDIKTGEPSLEAASAEQLKLVRREVEDEFEQICGVAFVPRFARERVDGTGRSTIVVPHPYVRSVRSVRVYTGTDFNEFDASELAALAADRSGRIVRTDGATFPAGIRNIVVEYEHGLDRPPADVKRAAVRRIRARHHMARSAIPDRAVSFTADNGATYRLATPGVTATGDPEIDAVLDRYSMRFGIA